MLPCSLEVLNLESNQIIKLDEKTFVKCQRLRVINLKGNPMSPIASVPETVFAPLRSLRAISIDWDEDGYETERIKRRAKSRPSRKSITLEMDQSLAPPDTSSIINRN